MRILNAFGWIVLYVVIYLLSTLVAGVGVAIGMVIVAIFQSARDIAAEPDFFRLIAESINYIIIAASLLSLFFFWLVLLLRKKQPLEELDLTRRMAAGKWMAATLIGAGTALALTGIMSLVNIERLLPEDAEMLSDFVSGNFLLSLVAIGLIIPLFEEVLFRGLILNELRKAMRIWPALLLQALIFAAFHLNLLQFIYTLPAGILLGLLYVRWGSLWAPIVVHVAWNSLVVCMNFFLPPLEQAHFWSMLAAGIVLLSLPLLFSLSRPSYSNGTLD